MTGKHTKGPSLVERLRANCFMGANHPGIACDRCEAAATITDLLEAAECFERWVDHYRNDMPKSTVRAMELAFGGKLRAALLRARGGLSD